MVLLTVQDTGILEEDLIIHLKDWVYGKLVSMAMNIQVITLEKHIMDVGGCFTKSTVILEDGCYRVSTLNYVLLR